MKKDKKPILNKKQITMSVLLLVLAAAIFVNWKFAGADGGLISTASSQPSKTGNAEFVATDEVTIDTDYFKNAKADREKAYSDAVAEFEEVENSAKASEEDKSIAYKAHIELVERQEKQTDIETLIKAKGFKECVVVISDNVVNVVVYSDELSNSEVLQVQDIVTSVHEINLENIKIINIK